MTPAEVPDELVEKAARAMWNAQTRQPWQQIDDGDEWPSWVDLATRDRLREKVRPALAAVLPEIQAQALREAAVEALELGMWSGSSINVGTRAASWLGKRAARLTATTEGTAT